MNYSGFNQNNRELEKQAKNIISNNHLLGIAFPEHKGRWTETLDDSELNKKHIDYIAQDGFKIDLKGISDNYDKLSISVFRKYENGKLFQVLDTGIDGYLIVNMPNSSLGINTANVYTINAEQIQNILRDFPLSSCRLKKEKTEAGWRTQYIADIALPSEISAVFGKYDNKYISYVMTIR